jgi:hypothetical protein
LANLQQALWNRYVWHRQTTNQLAAKQKRSVRWIRNQLDKASITRPQISPCPIAVVADMTFVRRTFGICVFRDPHRRKNLIWKSGLTETARIYHELRFELEKKGAEIKAAIIDGRPGIIDVFWDVPVQMCHFHQIAIIKRYLTSRPKLTAGKQLRQISLKITKSNEDEMRGYLIAWHDEWSELLKEKTYHPDSKRWSYTHRRLRSAYRSIKRNLPILYTYQKLPELKLPNTTNSLDGSFAHLKDMLRIHRGLKRSRKEKLINEILSK